jgi:hypothetical protein
MRPPIEIVPAVLGDRGGAIGAAVLATQAAEAARAVQAHT